MMSRAYTSIDFGLGGPGLAEYTLTALGAAVVLFDGEARIKQWNAAAGAMLGLPERELAGHRLSDDELALVDPDLEPITEITDPVRSVAADGEPVMGVVIGVRGGDEGLQWRMLNLVPVVGPGRAPRSVLVSICDVTDTFRARSRVADWQWMAHTLLRQSVSAALVVDRDGTILEWNDRALVLVGRSDADVIGSNLAEVCDLDLEWVWNELHQVGDSSLEGVTFVPRPDRSELAVFGRFTLAHWPGFGEVVFVQLLDPSRFLRGESTGTGYGYPGPSSMPSPW